MYCILCSRKNMYLPKTTSVFWRTNMSVQVPMWPKASSAQTLKCLCPLSNLSAWVSSDRVPKCSSSLQVPNFQSTRRLPWMFECPLSVFKCALCIGKIPVRYNQNKIISIKDILCIWKKDKNGREGFVELTFEAESECWFDKPLR